MSSPVELSTAGVPADSPTGNPPGPLHVVRVRSLKRFEGTDELTGEVLIIARQECEIRTTAFESAQPSVAYGRAHASSDLMAHDHCRTVCARFVACPIG